MAAVEGGREHLVVIVTEKTLEERLRVELLVRLAREAAEFYGKLTSCVTTKRVGRRGWSEGGVIIMYCDDILG